MKYRPGGLVRANLERAPAGSSPRSRPCRWQRASTPRTRRSMASASDRRWCPLLSSSDRRIQSTRTFRPPTASPQTLRNPDRRSRKAISAIPGSQGSPHRCGTRPGTRRGIWGSACRRGGGPPCESSQSPVKWIAQKGIITNCFVRNRGSQNLHFTLSLPSNPSWNRSSMP